MSNQEQLRQLLIAMKMNETIRWIPPATGTSKMPDDIWRPKISITPNTTGLLIKFSPPYPEADYHQICVMDDRHYCIGGGKKRVNKTDNEAFMMGIPSNESYTIMVRPYDTNGDYLDDWVSAKPYFYPHVKAKPTYLPDERSTTNLISTPTTQSPPPESYIVIVVVVVILLFLFIFLLLVVSFRKNKGFNFLRKLCKRCHGEDMVHHNYSDDNVTIIPVFITDHASFENMVTAHLEILNKFDRINASLSDSPFISNVKYNKVMENVEMWIDNELNSVLKGVNNHIIIYISEELLSCLRNTTRAERHDEICVRMIKKISEKFQSRNCKPFVVCFGCSSEFILCPPLTEFKRMIYVANQKEKGVSSSISFEGTEKLIQELLPIGYNYSLCSEETKDLRVMFMRHFHPERSSDMRPDVVDLSCDVESVSENEKLIHVNMTRLVQSEDNLYCSSGYRTENVSLDNREPFLAPGFQGPDSSSIYASQSSIQRAQIQELNNRANWN